MGCFHQIPSLSSGNPVEEEATRVEEPEDGGRQQLSVVRLLNCLWIERCLEEPLESSSPHLWKRYSISSLSLTADE